MSDRRLHRDNNRTERNQSLSKRERERLMINNNNNNNSIMCRLCVLVVQGEDLLLITISRSPCKKV